MYNCIYEDGSVVALEAGPCAPIGPGGAAFVDAYNEETVVNVIEPAPINQAGFTTLGWALLIGVGLLFLTDRRR